MAFEFKLPDVGEGVAEGTLENWLVEVGDTVTEDMPVAEVETDKALVEVPSPVNGTVKELPWDAGDVVPVGDTFVVFEVEGEETEAEAEDAAEPDAQAETAADAETPAAGGDGTAEAVETPEGRVFAAPSTRRLARELGVAIESVEGTGPGGRITDGDVRAAAEADEAAPEPTEAGDGQAGAGTAPDAEAEPAPPPGVEAADRERTLAAPATRRIAEEEGVDIDAVPATEQRDGEAFVTPEAVREYAGAQQRAQEADTEALAKYEEGEPAREERVPYTGVRRSIGDQMARSKFTAPHVTHHDEVDVTALVETREELKEVAEERGIKLTYMPFVMKACTAALKEFPLVNAALDDENDEIVKKNYYNVGVATATDVGLMVPVVDDVDHKGLLQIASETNELVTKARERSISREEMQGGTFTVTNIGGIGGEYATPILNYPQAAILAVGEIKKKPRVVERDGEEVIEPRHVLTLSLSFDHRVIDGAIGAQFTNEVMKYLENPKLLLLE